MQFLVLSILSAVIENVRLRTKKSQYEMNTYLD